MGKVWHVASHVDPDEVLDLSTPARAVLEGLSADWQWVVLRSDQSFYALTRDELVHMLVATERKRALHEGEPPGPDAALLPIRELLLACDFPPALVVDQDLWSREIERLLAGVSHGNLLRIIARVAGDPLVIWAQRDIEIADGSSSDHVRIMTSAPGPVTAIPHRWDVFERRISEAEPPGRGVGRSRPSPAAAPDRPAPPLPGPYRPQQQQVQHLQSQEDDAAASGQGGIREANHGSTGAKGLPESSRDFEHKRAESARAEPISADADERDVERVFAQPAASPRVASEQHYQSREIRYGGSDQDRWQQAGNDAFSRRYAAESSRDSGDESAADDALAEVGPTLHESGIDGAGAPAASATEEAPVMAGAAPAPADDPRWVNAEIEDHAAAEPLAVDDTYTLAVSIGATQMLSAGAVGSVRADPLLRDKTDGLRLTVSLTSNDFTIDDPERRLKIGKDGLSMGKARFDITPLRAGLGRLTAILHRENNFVQQLDISLQVGPGVATPASVVSTGRPIATSGSLSRRDIGLSIQPSPTGGFDCIVWGATSANVKLPISAIELDAEIEVARATLLRVVTAKAKDGTRPFQAGIHIEDFAREAALRAIALAGYTLFQKLFFHPAADQQCQALGEWLIAEIGQAKDDFTLQILARDFPVPWAMLYLAPEWKDDAIDFERFIGMKLVVEQIPLRNDKFGRDTRIPADPGGLSVSLNLNTDLDAQMHADIVASQEAYWNEAVAACPAIRLSRRTQTAELIDALNSADTDDQIVYFFCHAESIGLKGGGPGSSSLTLSGNSSVDLASLTVRAPARQKLRGSPLVFINACESGKLSPLFYNGFVPYFMSKGARGVIGTECQVPGRFAEAWAKDFFDDFLAGKPLGETVRWLRRNFYLRHGNPLGLLYGLHCSADTQIHPLPVRLAG